MIIQIEPWIDHEELNELKKVIESTFVTESAMTDQFEDMCKKLTGSRYAVAMTNGTLALYACLKALHIGPGDEVIVPDLTFIASANAVIMAGAIPVFCDILKDTLCLDVESASIRITPHTKAIMPVHLYGQSADMVAIMKLASEHGLAVLEDAAQGVGVRFLGQHVGTFGEMGILSFFGNKTVTCGEGGIVLTNDENLARVCYRLKNHGRDRKGVFIHEEIGYNFSFTEMQAAVGVAQMNKLPRIIQRKKEIHDRYVSALSNISTLTLCPIDPRTEPVFWFTSIFSNETEQLAVWLLHRNIQTRRFFYPLHLQPCYQKEPTIASVNLGPFPVTEEAYRCGLSLPSSYLLTDDQQDAVIKEIINCYEHRN